MIQSGKGLRNMVIALMVIDTVLKNLYLFFPENHTASLFVPATVDTVYNTCESLTFVMYIVAVSVFVKDRHKKIKDKHSLWASVLITGWIGFALFDVVDELSGRISAFNKWDAINLLIGLIFARLEYLNLKKKYHYND